MLKDRYNVAVNKIFLKGIEHLMNYKSNKRWIFVNVVIQGN